LEGERKVSKESAIEMKNKWDLVDYVETSALTGENVEKAFQILFESVYRLYSDKPI